jgi:hypothetical protein
MTTTPQPALSRLSVAPAPVPGQPVAEADEDPHSPGLISVPPPSSEAEPALNDDWGQPLGILTGGAIGLITLVVPLLCVIGDRGTAPLPLPGPASLILPQSDGSQPSPSLSGTGSGEPGGGDPGR